MKFTLYRSNCLEVPENCTYPHKVEVTGKDSLIEAVKHDKAWWPTPSPGRST